MDLDIADKAQNGRIDGGVFADAIALVLAGGCSIRLDLVTIFTLSVAGGSEGDLTIEDGELGASGILRWAGKPCVFDISPCSNHASVDANYSDDCDFPRLRR